MRFFILKKAAGAAGTAGVFTMLKAKSKFCKIKC
jgi:hypothetical protein